MHRRLRVLERKELIRRVEGLSEARVAWTLTTQSARQLGLESTLIRINRNTIEHDVLLSQVRIVLARVGIGATWRSEFALRQIAGRQKPGRQERGVVPDAIFALDVKGEPRALALELELHAKSKERYRKIFSAYRFKRSLWCLWYLVPNERFAKFLSERWRETVKELSPTIFAWSVASEVLENPLRARFVISGQTTTLADIITPAHTNAHSVSSFQNASYE